MSLANQLNDEFALPWTVVKIDMDHLLPCAQGKTAIYEGHGE